MHVSTNAKQNTITPVDNEQMNEFSIMAFILSLK